MDFDVCKTSAVTPSLETVQMLRHFLQSVPFLHVPPERVEEINTQTYAELKEDTALKIKEMHENRARLEEHYKNLLEQSAREAELREKEFKLATDRRIADMEAEFAEKTRKHQEKVDKLALKSEQLEASNEAHKRDMERLTQELQEAKAQRQTVETDSHNAFGEFLLDALKIVVPILM